MKSTLPNTPAAPVAAHIHRLRAGGMSTVAIAQASGLPVQTVYSVSRGRGTLVFGHTAARLTAVTTPAPTPPAGFAFAVASMRRTRALSRIGHPQCAQRAAIDMTTRPYFSLIAGQTSYISLAHAARLHDIYDRWSEADGPSLRTRAWAIKAGWHGPEAWTEDSIDDPDAQPLGDEVFDELAVQFAIDGDRDIAARLSTTERREVVRVLSARKATAATLADLCGVDARSIYRDRQLLRAQATAA
jgi:hypothetical protein